MGKLTISMAFFNSSLFVYQRVHPIKTTVLLIKPHSTTIKPPFSYGFLMVFQDTFLNHRHIPGASGESVPV
jgi:hypothetical protein